MTSSLICIFHSARSSSRIGLLKNKYFYHLVYRDLATESSQKFRGKYYENKYDEVRNRLKAISCLDLLHKELDGFKHDLSFEDDKRLEDLGKWITKVFEYNSSTTYLLSAEIFLKAFFAYGFSIDDASWNHWDSERWRLAAIMAWCIETITAHIIVLDDVVDQSVSRMRNPCWYRKPGVGLSAINDAQVLQWCNYKVLRKHFGKLKCYLNLLHEFNETNRRMAYGQSLVTYNEGNLNSRFKKFTFEMYKVYAENQAIQYMLYCPFHLAMHLTGRYSAKECDFVEKFCWKLGIFYQTKDDFLELILPVEIKGKKCDDIRNGKFTWFAIKFLEEAPENLKKQFLENYGVDDDDAVDNILELYEKMNILKRFQELEDELYSEISILTESTDVIQGALFYDLFHRSESVNED